jgi:hypothetical protein
MSEMCRVREKAQRSGENKVLQQSSDHLTRIKCAGEGGCGGVWGWQEYTYKARERIQVRWGEINRRTVWPSIPYKLLHAAHRRLWLEKHCAPSSRHEQKSNRNLRGLRNVGFWLDVGLLSVGVKYMVVCNLALIAGGSYEASGGNVGRVRTRARIIHVGVMRFATVFVWASRGDGAAHVNAGVRGAGAGGNVGEIGREGEVVGVERRE